LAAAITMKKQPRLLAGIAPVPGHLQCVDHQIAPHIGPHRPANYFTAEQIDHDSKKPLASGQRNSRNVNRNISFSQQRSMARRATNSVRRLMMCTLPSQLGASRKRGKQPDYGQPRF
jgi:hypothetical protein